MAVTYVKDFSFPSDFGFHKNGSATVPGKKHGGHVKASTPQAYKAGGQAKPTPPIATQGAGAKGEKFKQGTDHKFAGTRTEKSSGVQKPAFKAGGKVAGKIKSDKPSAVVNANDSVSPGSYKRTPPGQGVKNSAAVKSKFAAKDTPDATKQTGDVERMAGFSDFKHGGKVHKKKMGGSAKCYKDGGKVSADRFEREDQGGKSDRKIPAPDKKEAGDGKAFTKGGHNRIKNLGHYAHGGKVAAKYEKRAGTPKTSGDGSKSEHASGKAVGKHTKEAQGTKKSNGKAPLHEKHLASGGLSRGTGSKKNAAIHAKSKHQGPSAGALAALVGAAGAHQPPGPGMGPPPPGMAPGMGSPPGGPMGGGPMAGPPPGPMGPPGGMSHGGGVKHVIVHHVSHKA